MTSNDQPTFGGFFRTCIFVLVGIGLNLSMYRLTSDIGSLLFLDTIGTAVLALAYGPFHGALCGVLSAFIGGAVFFRPDFAAFALVHVVAATVWGMAPRLCGGRLCSDLFSPSYSYARQFLGILWIGSLAGVLSGITATYVAWNFSLPNAILASAPNGDGRLEVIRELTLHMYAAINGWEQTSEIPSWLVFALSQLVYVPDKVVTFATAVLIIAYLKPQYRVKMSGFFSHVIVTNRRIYSYFFIAAYVLAGAAYLYVAIGFMPATLTHLQALNFFIPSIVIWSFPGAVIFAKFIDPKLSFYGFTKTRQDELHTGELPHLERVFEDIVKAVTVAYAVFYAFIVSKVVDFSGGLISFAIDTDSLDAGGSSYPAQFDDVFVGAVGLIAVLTFHRYVALIVARCFRRETPSF